MPRPALLALVAISVALLVGCGTPPPTTPDAGDPNLRCDPSAPTVLTQQAFDQVVAPTCLNGCHVANGLAASSGEWDTVAKFQANSVGKKSIYGTGTSTLKYVDPAHPENSTVWLKVLGGTTTGTKGPKGENVGGKMPDGAAPLDEAKKQTLKNWICSGAKQS